MRSINREFRQIDSITDVLSFPMLHLFDGFLDVPVNKTDLIDPDTENPILFIGDILISIDRAYDQAEQYGHSPEREIAFLALHGMLHLLCYDHITQEREMVMINKQKTILQLLDLHR